MLPKKNPTAQGNGLPRDSANADTTTAIDESKEMTMKIKEILPESCPVEKSRWVD